MAAAYSRGMKGASNPNYSNANRRICTRCGNEFRSYAKTRKFCSQRCYHYSKPVVQLKLAREYAGPPLKYRPPSPKKQRPKKPRLSTRCLQCGTDFCHWPSQKRKYCSYACHLASGGARRAGLAAAKSIMKYGGRKDANHSEMIQALEKMGVCVIDTSRMGCGFPDLIISIPPHSAGCLLLADIKNPKTRYGRKGLNKLQRQFAEEWRGSPVYVLRTLDDVIAIATGQLDKVESFGGGKEAAIAALA
jgi:hypothetical protein